MPKVNNVCIVEQYVEDQVERWLGSQVYKNRRIAVYQAKEAHGITVEVSLDLKPEEFAKIVKAVKECNHHGIHTRLVANP